MEHWTWSRPHPSRAHEKDIKANLDKRICLLSASSRAEGASERVRSGSGTGIEPGQYEDRCKGAHTLTHSELHRKCLPLCSVSGLLLMGYISCCSRPLGHAYFPPPERSQTHPHPLTHPQTTFNRVRMHFKVANKSNNGHNRDSHNKVMPKNIHVKCGKGFFGQQNWTFGT